MKKLAIIGASYLQLPLIETAKSMGIETHVFAWAANDVGETAADRFYPISIVEKEQILDKCREIGVDGICSIASDLAAITVNYVAAKMGLTGNSVRSSEIATNKFEMRCAFAENGDPCPRFFCVDDAHRDFDLPFPVIVKPVDRSGSRGVTKVCRAEEIDPAIDKALAESFEKKAMIEEFVDGREYSVECISYRGEHHLLAVTEKHTTGAPSFIETGHMEPAPLTDETAAQVKDVVFHALDTLEVKNGASHSEIKIDGSEIKIIEIGARMGGDLIGSDLVRYSTGVDFVRAVIEIALGNAPDLTPHGETCSVMCKYLLTREDVEMYRRMQETEPDRILKTVNFNPDGIGAFSDSSQRNGGVFVFRV